MTRRRKWNTGKFGNVCHVVPGYAFKSKDWQKDGIPEIKIKNILSDNTIDVDNVDCVSESLMNEKITKYLLKDGDMIIAMTGATAGKAGRLRSNKQMLLNQRVAKIDSYGADRNYIWAIISSQDYQKRFFRLADGAAQPNMSGTQIENVDIPLPPEYIQKKISSTLSIYDDFIENNNRRIKILEKMAQTIYDEWFVKFRFPGHSKVKMVELELGKIPGGWEIKTVKEVVKRLKAGKTLTKNKVLPEGQIPVVDQSRSEFLGFHNDKPAHIASPENPIILFGDHTCKMQIMVEPFSLGPNVVPFIGREGYLIPYLYFTVRHLVETREYKRHWNELIIRKIVSPKREVQSAYSDIVTTLLEEVNILRKKNLTLNRMRDILLPNLISGKIDVENMDIDVGDVE